VTDTSTQPFRLGRLPIKPEGERFAIQWLHVYDPDVAPGAVVNYPVNVAGNIGDDAWLMLGNGPDPTLTVNGGQPVGDCGFVGVAHDEMLAGRVPTANDTVSLYLTYDGGQDNGVVVADMLLWLLTHDENGNAVAQGSGVIEMFAPVDPSTLGAVMSKYGRGILLGVNLTDCDQQTFPDWSVNANCQPNPNNGHVVYLVTLAGPISSPGGSGRPVSWGQRASADAAWMADCPEEWWLLLTTSDRAKMGEAGFDALAADLAKLPGVHGTVPTPPAPPSPTPTPPPTPPAPPTPPLPKPPPAPRPPQPPPEFRQWLHDIQVWAGDIQRWLEDTFGL
jgi:hypothetical protein